MELLQYWKVILKSMWIILALVAVGLAGSVFYTLNQPPEYESSATLLLNPSVPNSLVPFVQTQVAANLADSYTELMHSRSFADSVDKQLSFHISPSDLSLALTTKLVPNTLFYKISARMSTPEKAQELVSTVTEVFISANADQQAQANGGAGQSTDPMSQRLEDRLKTLDNQISEYEARIKTLEAQAPSQSRDDQLLQLRGQLVTLQQAETETMVASSQLSNSKAGVNTAIVIDKASSAKPVPSKLPMNLGLSLAVALLLGVGVAFFRDYLDYSIHSPEQLEQVLGIPAVAAVGLIGAPVKKGQRKFKGNKQGPPSTSPGGRLAGHKLVTLEAPKSPEAESFRSLRTNIQFSSMDKPLSSIVVTSSGPREGKSFTASNLAIVMAKAGKRVILVDADLRKPSQHKLFEMPNTVGFTNLILSKSIQVDGAIQAVPGVSNLAVITSGPLPPNPSELLNSRQATYVMDQLAEHADVIIYDAPPVAAVTDPVILATKMDAVVLVISANGTRRDMAVRAKQNLLNVGVTNVLPVLNRVKNREMQGYYYYHYYGSDTQHLPADANTHVGGNGYSTNGKGAIHLATDATLQPVAAGQSGERKN